MEPGEVFFGHFHARRSLVKAHDRLHDGQAKAGTTLAPCSALIHTVEPLKQMRMVFLSDTAAWVADAQGRTALTVLHLHVDRAAARAVADRIRHKVRDGPLNHQAVSAHHVITARDLQLDLAFLCRNAEEIAHSLNLVDQGHGFELHHGRGMTDLGQEQHVGNHAAHAVQLFCT